jgi:hypothetical protein
LPSGTKGPLTYLRASQIKKAGALPADRSRKAGLATGFGGQHELGQPSTVVYRHCRHIGNDCHLYELWR